MSSTNAVAELRSRLVGGTNPFIARLCLLGSASPSLEWMGLEKVAVVVRCLSGPIVQRLPFGVFVCSVVSDP